MKVSHKFLVRVIVVIHYCISVTVVPDDDLVEEPFEEPSDELSGTRTPPTPDVSPSHGPPPTAPPLRQRAMAQLRPVSVPAVMISGTLASICHPYQLIEATLMYMVQSITIRYESTVSVCL